MRTKNLVLFLFIISGLSFPSLANWQLINEQSTLDFISTKNEHISESHTFTTLGGSIDKAGNVQVNVDLATVETMIPIRNDRMQEHLFKTNDNPTAILKALLPKKIIGMEKGTTALVTLDAEIGIGGKYQNYNLTLQVSRNSNGSFVASTAKPILINATSYNLTPGIEMLKQLAGLNSISLIVPVTFSVMFEQIH